MSKKHFESIAATIAEQVRGHRYNVSLLLNATSERLVESRVQHTYAINVLQATSEKLADQFAVINPRFDRQKFLTAAGF
jgi:hypothetical protein